MIATYKVALKFSENINFLGGEGGNAVAPFALRKGTKSVSNINFPQNMNKLSPN